METLLKKIGLSDKEAKVYLALLELAEDSVQNIGKKAGVNRATTYVILEKLMGFGLASQVKKGKKTLFVAEDPHELNNILEEQKKDIELREAELAQNMNRLTAIHNQKKGKPTVRYFEGEDGLVALDRYSGPTEETKSATIYGVMPLDIVEELFPQRRKEGLSKRVVDKAKSYLIYTHNEEVFSPKRNKEELRESVFIPRKDLPIDMTVSILPWGVKFFNLSQSNPFGILIEDENIARNMLVVYKLAWEGAVQDHKVVK